MVDSNTIAEDTMNEFIKKINDNAESMADWGKAIQFIFADINVGYWFKVANDGHVEKFEKVIKDKNESNATLTFKTPMVLKDVLEKKTNAQTALGIGDVKVDGSINDLLQLNLVFS